MPRILRNLKINEVSGVDKGAGRGVRIMLMKRDDGALDWNTARTAVDQKLSKEQDKRENDALQALNTSIASIVADDTCADKVAKIDESISQFNAYLSLLGQQQETADMTPEEMKTAIEAAVGKAIDPLKDEISKRDVEIAILKMSDKAKAHHDALSSDEAKKAYRAKSQDEQDDEADKAKKMDKAETAVDKALTTMRTENDELRKQLGSLLGDRRTAEFKKRAIDAGLREEDGDVMLKAFDGDIEAQSELQKRFTETLKAARAQAKSSVLFGEFGKGGQDRPASAYQEIEAKAAELRKLDPKLSKEQAFTKAFTDPANAEIVARDQQEQSNKLLRLAASGQS